MRWVAVAFVLASACSKKQAEVEEPCEHELTSIAVPQLVKTFDGGDADAFHHATEAMSQATMCGPDFAALMREWEQSLRETDATKAGAQRKALVVRIRDEWSQPRSENDFAAERKALAPLFEKVK
jgi:hypothetical protein